LFTTPFSSTNFQLIFCFVVPVLLFDCGLFFNFSVFTHSPDDIFSTQVTELLSIANKISKKAKKDGTFDSMKNGTLTIPMGVLYSFRTWNEPRIYPLEPLDSVWQKWTEDIVTGARKREDKFYNRSLSIGELNIKVAPLPLRLFSAQILPPWASTILLQIYNPKPVPFGDALTNFVNSLGSICRCIPNTVPLCLQ
jgi:hypothetical protein